MLVRLSLCEIRDDMSSCPSSHSEEEDEEEEDESTALLIAEDLVFLIVGDFFADDDVERITGFACRLKSFEIEKSNKSAKSTVLVAR